ncbi:MAG: hypothetical protein HQ564_01455 [Candidatus Saganbacteria bacterium]|nr:hypothetical protein [Candidatus Saganbacteria bacterium]
MLDLKISTFSALELSLATNKLPFFTKKLPGPAMLKSAEASFAPSEGRELYSGKRGRSVPTA